MCCTEFPRIKQNQPTPISSVDDALAVLQLSFRSIDIQISILNRGRLGSVKRFTPLLYQLVCQSPHLVEPCTIEVRQVVV